MPPTADWMTTLGVLLPLCAMAIGPREAGASAPERADDAAREEIRRLLREVPLVDGHIDLPWQLRDRFENDLARFDFRDLRGLDPPVHTDLTRLRQGGVGGVFWAVYVDDELPEGEALKATFEQLDVVHRLIRRYPELELARTADDVERIHGAGKVASLIGVEGAHGLGGSLAVLRQLHALGARYLTLTHWHTNAFADAATDAPRHGGLSDQGLALISELNRLGMLVDLSHVSDDTVRDVLRVSRAPVLFSHSSARALCDHPRNLPDDLLQAVADQGGVVMVNFGTWFLSEEMQAFYADYKAEEARLQARYPGSPEEVKRRLETWEKARTWPKAPLSLLADHVEHVRRVAGARHVGLGSDFDGVRAVAEGVDDVSGYPNLLLELKRRGWTRDELADLAGRNVLRVLRQAEAVARAQQGGGAAPARTAQP